MQILRRLLDKAGQIDAIYAQSPAPQAVPTAVPTDWAEVYSGATEAERELLVLLAEAGTVRPELGAESAGGIPVPLAWPDLLLAADLGLARDDKADLEAEGGRCSRWGRSSTLLRVQRPRSSITETLDGSERQDLRGQRQP